MEKIEGCWACKAMRHQCQICRAPIGHPADNEAPLCARHLTEVPTDEEPTMEQDTEQELTLRVGQGVTNKEGQLGIITDTYYTRGKDRTLWACGVIWLGGAYALREQAKSLQPIILVQAGK